MRLLTDGLCFQVTRWPSPTRSKARWQLSALQDINTGELWWQFSKTRIKKGLIPFHGRCERDSQAWKTMWNICFNNFFLLFIDHLLPSQFQIGEYFGAAVCAMDVDLDSYTDLILISAPMFIDTDREGRVYVCTLTSLVSYSFIWIYWFFSRPRKHQLSLLCFHQNVECHLDSPSVLRGDASASGRFGSSLAVLPDLNADGFGDLAVGAPLEDDGQGGVYIFHGAGGGGIHSAYSQVSEIQHGTASHCTPDIRLWTIEIYFYLRRE